MKLTIFKIVMRNVFHSIQVGFVMILHLLHTILEQKILHFLKLESKFLNFVFSFMNKPLKNILFRNDFLKKPSM